MVYVKDDFISMLSPPGSCCPRPGTARGLLRLEAEQAWTQLAVDLQLPLTIFRLGGDPSHLLLLKILCLAAQQHWSER
jgi:hypothetical protein